MKHRVHVCLILRLFVAGIILFGTQRSATAQNLGRGDSVSPLQPGHSSEAEAKERPADTKVRAADSFARLPLSFEANQGQADPEVKFLARGQGYTLFLTRRAEAVLVLQGAAKKEKSEPSADPPAVLRMKLAGATLNPEVAGLEELAGRVNYFVGKDPREWHTDVPTYARVNFSSVYPGIDLAYYGNRQQLEYDFIVSPHANPQKIAVSFEGAEAFSVDPNGDLVLTVNKKELRFRKPVVYQEIDGRRREVASTYMLKGKRSVGFEIAAYDPSRRLIIDPTLVYSTYLGGSMGSTGALSVVADSAGNSYITGYTYATDFPTTPGVFHTNPPSPCNGCAIASAAVFVTKLNPDGSAPVFSTYVGGSADNHVTRIAIDSADDVYITGYTDSSDFPTTPGAYQTVFLGKAEPPGLQSVYNAFVAELNPTGTALIYSTYLGSSNGTQASGIAVDGAGNAFVSGSTGDGFPTTPGAFQTAYRATNPFFNAFVSKLNPAGSALVYSTYLGGSGEAQSTGIAVDASGSAYVTGFSYSADFPTTIGAFDPVFPVKNQPDRAAFVSKLNANGSTLVYSTYLGGLCDDAAYGIGVDTQNNAYVAGTTCSINFPTTPGAFETVVPFGPTNTAFSSFVTKLNPSGSGLVYSTYLDGSKYSFTLGLALDSAGDAFVLGYTNSIDFPRTPNAMQPVPAAFGYTSFVSALNPAGSSLLYSSYFGDLTAAGYGIAVDSSANAYIVGPASSGFPTTPNAFQPTNPGAQNGWSSAFVTKFSGFQPPQ